jgi:flagellar basal-body rod protein FlgG
MGDTIMTSNPLDMLIDGPGFFRVTNAAGESAYTRDGHFRLNADGQVVSQDGSLLDPEIQLSEGESLRITSDGTIYRDTDTGDSVESVNAGTLSVITFPNPAGLEAMGGNMFRPTSESGDPTEGTPGEPGVGGILQGALEGSNVDAAEELVAMITAQRSYELSSKVIQTSDEMMQTAVQLRR